MEKLRKAEMLKVEEEAKKQKIREKEALIDELMFADGDAKEILNTFAQTVANKKEEVVPVVPKVCIIILFVLHNILQVIIIIIGSWSTYLYM